MKCVNHLEIDAAALCNHCGKSVCQDCQVHEKGEIYCKECFLVKGGQVKKQEHSPALAAIAIPNFLKARMDADKNEKKFSMSECRK